MSGMFDLKATCTLHSSTGVKPAIVGEEYARHWGIYHANSVERAVEWRDLNPRLIDRTRNGAIVGGAAAIGREIKIQSTTRKATPR